MSENTRYITSLKKGSYSSFEILYNRYVGTLHSFIYKLTGDKEISKDIVQETFVKIWLSRENIDESQNIRNYIFTVARNLLLNELRRKINNTLPLDTISQEYFNTNSTQTLGGHNEKLLEKIDLARRKLSPRQRQLFEMNKIEGLSVKEIASLTQLSEQSIRNQIHLAVKFIRENIQVILGVIYSFLCVK